MRLEDSNNYQIRSATLDHTCSVEERSNYHKVATTRMIGSIMKAKYEGNTRGPRAIDLQRLLLADHSVRFLIGRHGNPGNLLWREQKDHQQIAFLFSRLTYMYCERLTLDPLLNLKQKLMQKVSIGLNTCS